MNLADLLKSLYDTGEFRILLALIAADLVLGIVLSLLRSPPDFRLAKVADFLHDKVIPLTAAYGVASLLSFVGADLKVPGLPVLPAWRDAAFALLLAALVADLLDNFRALGVDFPPMVASTWINGRGTGGGEDAPAPPHG